MEKELDIDAKRVRLETLIEEMEDFVAQKAFQDLDASITEDVESCIDRITKQPPETLGQFFAHWVDIGRLAGLRTLQQRPRETLSDLRNELLNLDA